MTDKIYNHTEYTEITQYNVEDANTFMGGKKYVPVFHWLQQRPSSDEHPNPIEYHEWYVEIGWPADAPRDTEMYDDEILAQSWIERPVHPDAIYVSPTTWTVKLATPLVTLQLAATVIPTSSEFPITWNTTSDKVTVSSTWLVTPVAVGEDIAVTATSWAVSASAVIKVEKVAVSSVAITEESITLAPDAEQTLTLTVSPSDAYIQTVTWESSDENVATVDETGKVTAVAVGTATITVTSTDDDTKTDTCTVNVAIPVESVALDESSITLTEWWTQQLTATISPNDATDQTVIWSSSDETVATVEGGLVTALAEWTATITVTSHADWTITDDCSVTVNAA